MNQITANLVCVKKTVLIDTWWNVNIKLFVLNIVIKGFNRYMVECEFGFNNGSIATFTRFNRYMVECESFCKGFNFL